MRTNGFSERAWLRVIALLCVLSSHFQTFGAATIPQEERCSAVFIGKVKSVAKVRVREQNLGRYGTWTKLLVDELWKAEVVVETASKLPAVGTTHLAVYYEQPFRGVYEGQGNIMRGLRQCPGFPDISVGHRAKFFCLTQQEGTNNVLFIPEFGWVHPIKE